MTELCPPTTAMLFIIRWILEGSIDHPINEHWTSNDTEYGQLQWILKHLK